MNPVNVATSMPIFLTDGISKQNKTTGNWYNSYIPVSEIGEIKDTVVGNGRVRTVFDKEGKEIFTVGEEGRLYTTEQVLNQKLNIQA